MNGHLRLTAASGHRTGATFIAAQSFRSPMHVGKGHWNEADRLLTVHAVNATAGLFAGDEVRWDVRVKAGARLRLVSPSASRVHRSMRAEAGPDAVGIPIASASMQQHFTVERGGWLEVWPELFIPHAGSRYRQATRIEIEPGGGLLYCEGLAPGRVASGEAFAFDSLQWATDVLWGDEPVARERWRMSPGQPESLSGWRAGGFLGPAPCYGNVFFVSAGVREDAPCWQRIHDIHDGSDLWIGVSRLRAAGWMVRLLARDGAVLRRALGQVRGVLLGAVRAPELHAIRALET